LRFGVYRELIEAEKLAETLLPKPVGGLQARVVDFNKDGRDEIVVEGEGFHAILEPSSGGTLSELDYLEKPINLSDTLTRRRESYHRKLLAHSAQGGGGGDVASIHDRVRVKEEGLDRKLFYDRQRRSSLVDRFLPPTASLEDMRSARAPEWGDFRNASFDFKVNPPKKKGEGLRVLLSRKGVVRDQGEGLPVKLEKKLTFAPGPCRIAADYEVKNLGNRDLGFLFAVEWNMTLLAGDAPDRRYFVAGRELAQPRLISEGEELKVTEMGMEDDWLGLRISFKTSSPAKFWRYPVETISQSEGGFEKVYQGSCLLLGWEVSLAPGALFETRVTTGLEEKAP